VNDSSFGNLGNVDFGELLGNDDKLAPRKMLRAYVTLRMKHRVATKLYSFSKENIDKTLKTMERWLSQPFLGSGVDYARGRY
jgi:hypothetical protein